MPAIVKVPVSAVFAPVVNTGRIVVTKHVFAAVKHPHHYVTATLIHIVCVWQGYHGEAITLAWVYAICETIASGEDELKHSRWLFADAVRRARITAKRRHRHIEYQRPVPFTCLNVKRRALSRLS